MTTHTPGSGCLAGLVGLSLVTCGSGLRREPSAPSATPLPPTEFVPVGAPEPRQAAPDRSIAGAWDVIGPDGRLQLTLRGEHAALAGTLRSDREGGRPSVSLIGSFDPEHSWLILVADATSDTYTFTLDEALCRAEGTLQSRTSIRTLTATRADPDCTTAPRPQNSKEVR